MDGLEKGTLLGLICDYGEVDKTKIGKIDLKGAYSFFEVEKDVTEKVMKGFEGVEVRGRKVRLEMTGPKTDRPAEDKPERKKEWSGGARPRSGGSSRDGGNRDGGEKKRSWGGGGNDRKKRW